MIPPNPDHEHTSRACRVFRNSLLHLPRGIHFPRLAERVVLHPNIRRFRALCFGKSPADTAKFWRKAPRAGPDADLGPAEQEEDPFEELERPRPRPRDQDELTAVFKQLAETIGKAVGKGKGSGGNPDPEECPKYPGVKGDYLQYRRRSPHGCTSVSPNEQNGERSTSGGRDLSWTSIQRYQIHRPWLPNTSKLCISNSGSSIQNRC